MREHGVVTVNNEGEYLVVSIAPEGKCGRFTLTQYIYTMDERKCRTDIWCYVLTNLPERENCSALR